MISLKNSTLLFCLIAFFSCADNLDFNQIDDYNITPEITSSLVYFALLPTQFFDSTGTVPISEISDVSVIKVFDNDFIRSKLVKADFNIEIKNEFDRDFTVQVDLLNENNSITHRFNELQIEANNLTFTDLQTVIVSANINVKNTRKIRITIKIENSTIPLNKDDTREFEFKSSATIYIDTDA